MVEPAAAVPANALLPEVYPSFEAALAECGQGYSDAALNAVRFYKAANIIQQLSRGAAGDGLVATAAETIGIFQIVLDQFAQRCHVLDFGGGFALTYFLLRRRTPIPLRWAVVETPLTAAMGGAFESAELRFFDSVDAAHNWLGAIDVVHANGVLQYVPSPEIVLQQLAGFAARYVALLRCPLGAGSRSVQIQQSPLSEQYAGPLPAGVADRWIRYPHTSMSDAAFDLTLASAGYVKVHSAGQRDLQSAHIALRTDDHRLYEIRIS